MAEKFARLGCVMLKTFDAILGLGLVWPEDPAIHERLSSP
jgi:hypothetical protein